MSKKNKDFPNILPGYIAHYMNEFPPVDPEDESVSVDVVIDLFGTRKDFDIGFYHFKLKKWVVYSNETIDHDSMWMDILPFASRD